MESIKYLNLAGLQVRFRHDLQRKITHCISAGLVPDQEIGAKAKCGLKDSFCREEGRKVSLLRLMKDVRGFDRKYRYAVWEAYRLMPSNPRWPQSTLGAKRIKREEKRSKQLQNQNI